MNFNQWWIRFRGFDDWNSKEGFREAFEAGVEFEKTRCRYPDCVDNEDEKCSRWLAGECPGPREVTT